MLTAHNQNVLTSLFGRSTTLLNQATWYVALGSGTVTNFSTGAGWTEIAGNGYARVAYANSAGNWNLSSLSIRNTNSIVWPGSLPGAYGLIRSVAIFLVASSAGTTNMFSVGNIPDTAIVIGDIPYLAPNSLIITLNNV